VENPQALDQSGPLSDSEGTVQRARRLSATGYLEWFLGEERERTAMHVCSAIGPQSGALFARNSYNSDLPGRTAVFDVDEMAGVSWCADRREFLGLCERQGITVNGIAVPGEVITMVNDTRVHPVEVRIAQCAPASPSSPVAERVA
jgi:cellobiose phosphorylase